MVVKNDINLGEDGGIVILTGPNRGGKTTYTQGAGESFLMTAVLSKIYPGILITI